MLLVGLLATAMPVIHMRGGHYGEIAKSPADSFSSGHYGRSAGLGVSPSCSRREDCGVCDGGSPSRCDVLRNTRKLPSVAITVDNRPLLFDADGVAPAPMDCPKTSSNWHGFGEMQPVR